jgi:hypothetical protein
MEAASGWILPQMVDFMGRIDRIFPFTGQVKKGGRGSSPEANSV